MSATIVVGVTGAPVTRRAVEWAARRAVDRRQSIELVSVVGGAVGAVGEGPVLDELLRTTQAMLEAEADRVRGFGASVTTRVARGNPVAQLAEASRTAALLVIGSDARAADERHRGVHGVRITAAAACPVVVVPDIEVEDRHGVVVGVDGSPVSEHAIAFAAAEADRLREPLIAVTVWTPLRSAHNPGVYPEQYLVNMEKASAEALGLSLAGLRTQYPDLEIIEQVERGYPSQVIVRLSASARLAVLGTHGRGAVGRFLLGSISHEVLLHLGAPTAIVR